VTPNLSPIEDDDDDLVAWDLVALPTSQTFTSFDRSSTQLQGTFVISGNFSANVTLELFLFGEDEALYAAPDRIIVAVVSLVPIPFAPVLLSAVLDNSGSKMTIKFSQHVDLSSLGQVLMTDAIWTCSSLFIFLNDSQTSCVWQTDQIVQATLWSSLILPGDNITLK
jgi:hypothetical protein